MVSFRTGWQTHAAYAALRSAVGRTSPSSTTRRCRIASPTASEAVVVLTSFHESIGDSLPARTALTQAQNPALCPLCCN
jgi:hypothetical protein